MQKFLQLPWLVPARPPGGCRRGLISFVRNLANKASLEM
jgi:hypothetical protein